MTTETRPSCRGQRGSDDLDRWLMRPLIMFVFSRRSVFPLHEGDRESSVSCQVVGEGENETCFCFTVNSFSLFTY